MPRKAFKKTSCVPSAASEVSPSIDRKSTRLNSSHLVISYAVFCLKKKKLTSNQMERQVKALLQQIHTHTLLDSQTTNFAPPTTQPWLDDHTCKQQSTDV